MKGAGIKTLTEICKKDSGSMKMIRELNVVKNAIELLRGRKKEGGGGVGKRVEDEKDKEDEERKGRKEDRGGKVRREWRMKEKIGLLELLSGLVKRGVEMEDEEGLEEIGMELEEEGNQHVEGEEIEGEGKEKGGGGGGEEEEEEKREWEELSEKAHQFVWVLNKMKARREGRKSQTLRMMKRMEEKDEKLQESDERMGSGGTIREEKEKMKKESYRVIKVTERKLINEMGVLFGDWSILKVEHNSIVHNSEGTFVSAFIGEKMTSSVHRMFE